ncbi:MAG: hypothetical protein NT121_11895 [Chloroflexi bacterium]|nr:hypothetical protein [Chloroflexota bacterium]
MRRFDFRIIIGAGLMLLGGLMLLEKFGILRGAGDLFWGSVFLLAAAYFLYIFVQSPQSRWWAIIPAMAFLGMGGSALLPLAFSGLGGGAFLGALGAAFFIIYIADRSRWWSIIPGGVLLTLATIAVLSGTDQIDEASGSLFFVGLGLTFLLVALLPNPFGKMQWAYIPAFVLILMGALLGSRSAVGLADYIWPAALIIVGLLVVFGFFFNKE